MCWLNDATIRPYLYQTDPKSIFEDIITQYNAVVEPWKQFSVGTVTVTDPNDYIRLESSSAEQAYDVVMKLVDRCGGYIFFESLKDGTRTINWYADMPYACSQKVALGSNLTSYAKDPNLVQFATRVIPYGAQDADGNRLQINVDGKDYFQDDEAVKLRGVIEASVIFDDITTEENLVVRAEQWLQEAKLIPYSIQLGAVDLSKQGYDVDSFAVGQRVIAESEPHELSGYYDLTALSEDLCDPRIGSVTFGRETSSIVGADATSKRKTDNAIAIAMREIAEQRQEIKNQEAATTEKITAAIQDSEKIVFSALEGYAKNSDLSSVKETISSELNILAGNVEISVSETRQEITSSNDALQAKIENLRTDMASIQATASGVEIKVQSIIENGVNKVKTDMGYTFDDDGLNISKEGDEIENLINNRGVYVGRGEQTMLRADADGVDATNVTVNNFLHIAHSRFQKYSNGTDTKRTGCFWIP